MRLGSITSNESFTWTCTNQQVGQCIVRPLLVLGRTIGKLGLTRLTTTRTWGKPPPSPLQYTLCLAIGPTPKWHFVPGLPSQSPKIPTTGILATLEAHNFVCKPLIEMRFKKKLQPLSRAFQRQVTRHLHTRNSGRFLTFSARKSNCQFDSLPFFWP